MMKASDWTGLAADFLTLVAGIILAADAIMAVEHFKGERLHVKTAGKVRDRFPVVDKKGRPMDNEDDIHLNALRRLALWAKIGSAVLISGYVLQLITRLIDILQK